MSNKIPSVESAAPSETIEQGLELGESGGEKDVGKNVEKNLVEGTRKEKKVLHKDIRKNGNNESPSTANNRKKRKFPSREEISRAR